MEIKVTEEARQRYIKEFEMEFGYHPSLRSSMNNPAVGGTPPARGPKTKGTWGKRVSPVSVWSMYEMDYVVPRPKFTTTCPYCDSKVEPLHDEWAGDTCPNCGGFVCMSSLCLN